MARGGAQTLTALQALLAERTGSSLSPQQRDRLDACVGRMRNGRTDAQLLEHLSSPQGEAELQELMASLSVHKTDLFRDEVQLGAFFTHCLRPLALTARPLSVWSAGCATGEEVATLLILLTEAAASPQSVVLGTDLSRTALERARPLSFTADVMKRVSPERRQKWFTPVGAEFQLSRALARQARFERHNLMDTPYPKAPFGDGFDIIFCRNVLIYFNETAFDRTVQLLSERLAPGGVLVLSSAEPILRPQSLLETQRHGEAFFSVRREENRPRTVPTPSATPKLADAVGRQPTPRPMSMPSLALTPPAPTPYAGLPSPVGPLRTPSPPGATDGEGPPTDGALGRENPIEESRIRFQRVLAWASAGKDEAEAEAGLRRCLYLDPHFAQARYLLGMLLEGKGQHGEAASEYRRALAALVEEKARPAPFFLNDERLKLACVQALKRLGLAR